MIHLYCLFRYVPILLCPYKRSGPFTVHSPRPLYFTDSPKMEVISHPGKIAYKATALMDY
jgi:hypothetical protein